MEVVMSSRFERLGSWSTRHHWRALACWVVALAAITGSSLALGNAYRDNYDLPGSESQQVADAVGRDASAAAIQIVVHDEAGLTSPQVRARVDALRTRVAALPHVQQVADPYTSPGAVSPDGETSFFTVTLDTAPMDADPADVRELVSTARAHQGHGLEVELAGDAVQDATAPGGSSEGIGMLAALLILIPLFGSILAAGLPLITAVFAVGSSVGLVALVSHLATVPTYAAPLLMLGGLGVGLDYALLVFSRYRSELLRGADRDAATARALDTAGRSVLFAGCTVIIALLGLLMLGLAALQGLALTIALTVLLTMVASITLLPALLTLFGRRLERAVQRRASRSGRTPGDRWRLLADRVQRRPLPVLIGGLAILLLLAAPVLHLRLGFADAGTNPPDSTTRKAYDLLADGFGPGASSPLIVLAESDQRGAQSAARVLRTTPGVADVRGPLASGSAGWTLIVTPTTAPASEQTTDLVHRLRDDVLPSVDDHAGGRYLVGGATPATIDFSDAVGQRLPWFIGAVVLLSALLLMVVFRSLVIAVKAALLNLLSIAAALGVMTFVFGDGHFGAQPGPIEAFLPVVVFAVVFGLSMDYEVFLVSRIHEEWQRTGDATAAVREGLAMTGGVITAAAAIMIVVFGAFLASPGRMLQEMGLGLAVAVLLDAVVIRCLVVPVVLRLLGERAWWLPRWIGRLLPPVRLEPEGEQEPSSRHTAYVS
jgi:RND superfamily putative drug exporter